MNSHPEHPLRDTQTGFTLVELVIVIGVLGILSAYAMMRGVSPDEMSLPSQAQTMASDIRRAQTLAYTSGRHMRLTITAGANGTYGAACVTLPTPCNTDFNVTLQKHVVLNVVPPATATLDFNTLGQPSDSAGIPLASATSYTLCFPSCTGSKETIAVAALTGAVTVTP
jgi:MSHA pilin protein MshC